MQGPAVWLESNMDIWPFVMPEAAVKKLMAATDDSSWVTLSAEIQKVVASGALGSKLFGFALQLVLCELVEKVIATECENMVGTPPVSNDAYLESVKKAKVGVAAIAGVEALPERRSISLRYRGWPLTLKIQCLAEEINFRHAVALRGLAVANGDLIPMTCEEISFSSTSPNLKRMCVELYGSSPNLKCLFVYLSVKEQLLGAIDKNGKKGTVAMDILTHASQAREWANSLLDGCDSFDPEVVQAISEQTASRYVEQRSQSFSPAFIIYCLLVACIAAGLFDFSYFCATQDVTRTFDF